MLKKRCLKGDVSHTTGRNAILRLRMATLSFSTDLFGISRIEPSSLDAF